MTNKKIITTAPELDGDQELKNLKAELKKSHLFEMAAIMAFVLFAGWIFSMLYRSPALRFAITHPVESTKFAEGYYRVQNASKEAASEVVTNWVKERI